MMHYKFIDIHYHANPDLYQRRHGVFDTGKYYKKFDGAVFLKSHLGASSIQATIAQKEGLPIFPSLVLNSLAGGINYRVVLQALAEYQPTIPSKLIVHLPTITGRKHNSKLVRELSNSKLKEDLLKPTTIFNSSNKLKPEIIDLLKAACDYHIVLSTGHASRDEVYALIEACNKWNVPALLLNQPANPLTNLTTLELEQITTHNNFVWVEQTALTYLLGYQTKENFAFALKNIPNLIYSSDLGQLSQMDIADWIQVSEQWFLEFQITPQRRDELCLKNPLKLVQI